MKHKPITYHKLYHVWNGMNERCYNTTHISYKDYGGRGIKVYDEWRNSYINFYYWAIKYWKEGLQIDRIDNNKGYYPDNCQFVTPMENSQSNKKRNRPSNTGIKNISFGVGKFHVKVSSMGNKLVTSCNTLQEAIEYKLLFEIQLGIVKIEEGKYVANRCS